MKEIVVTRYQAADGTEFATPVECKKYEKIIALKKFFTSLDVYGVETGIIEEEVDLGYFCSQVLENRKKLKEILDD